MATEQIEQSSDEQFEEEMGTELECINKKINDIENENLFSSFYKTNEKTITEFTEEDIKEWSLQFKNSMFIKALLNHPLLKAAYEVILQGINWEIDLFPKNVKISRHSDFKQAFFDDPIFVEAFAVIRQGVNLHLQKMYNTKEAMFPRPLKW